jgi:outer membrane immunogenic protein
MRRLLLGIVALSIVAGRACAAEIEPVVAPTIFTAPPAFPPARGEPVIVPNVFTAPPGFPQRKIYNWTGVYVGINAGGTFGNVRWNSVPDLTSGRSDFSGGLVGGTIGYNLQTGDPLVLGVEADLGWSGLSATVPPLSCAPGCEISVPWLATARLRVGYAFDWILPYVTAGVAIGHLRTAIVGAPFGADYANNLGWTVGFGVELVIWGPWRGKIEYLYADLNGLSCNIACGSLMNRGPISFNVGGSIIRAGFNYRIWDM